MSLSIFSSQISQLVNYASSNSSMNSDMSYMSYDIPQLILSTGGRSWTQTQTLTEEENAAHGMSTQLLWLKKPY